MDIEGFVCWTAHAVDDPAELRRVLDAQLPDPGSRAVADAQGAGLLEGTDLRPAGLAAAHAFAERSDLPMAGPTAAIADFSTLMESLDAAERRGGQVDADAVPEGFETVTPTVDRFDRSYHTLTVAREYASGAAVELNYRSRDPSHPGERRANRSSAILWLRERGATTYEHRVEWEERGRSSE
ncbi:MAG: hypothetical protein ABEH58_02290 [Haloplanus sp.]